MTSAILPIVNDYRRLFLSATPFLDVRAPVEFQQGAFPNTTNLPLLMDSERHQVGLTYAQQGQDAAVALGNQLVSREVRSARIEQWLKWCREHPNGLIYCFRGGLRSQTVQSWLASEGCPYPRIEGGYKAMRRFLLETLDRASEQCQFIVVSGRTGCGKTRVLQQLPQSLDLEAHAHHRGSAFGRHPGGQPAQSDFEHRIAVRLLHLMNEPDLMNETGTTTPIIVEDESKLIGRLLIPPRLLRRIKASPHVLIEEDLTSRVDVTLHDYVLQPLQEWAGSDGMEAAWKQLAAHLLGALDRIRNRLGGARHQELRSTLEQALSDHRRGATPDCHRPWIRRLLGEYYDPMYDHALRINARGAPLFVGSRAETTQFLATMTEERRGLS